MFQHLFPGKKVSLFSNEKSTQKKKNEEIKLMKQFGVGELLKESRQRMDTLMNIITQQLPFDATSFMQ